MAMKRISPPKCRARSRMPASPHELAVSRLSQSMPVPSSSTSIRIDEAAWVTRTSTRVAPAWRTTLVNASCNMRNKAVLRSGSSSSSTVSGGIWVRQTSPALAQTSSACHSSAAHTPSWSSTLGRSSVITLRTAAVAVSSKAQASSSRACKVPPLRWSCIRATERWALTPVKTLPSSSCISLAIRMRSPSFTRS